MMRGDLVAVTVFCIVLLGLNAYQVYESKHLLVRHFQLQDRYARLATDAALKREWQPEDAQGQMCEYLYNENGVLEAVYISAYEEILIRMRLAILPDPRGDSGAALDTRLFFDGEGASWGDIEIRELDLVSLQEGGGDG